MHGVYSLIGAELRMHSIDKNSFQQIRLTDDEYNGHPFLDIRIYTKGEGGQYYPTRQGLAVPKARIQAFTAMCNEYVQESLNQHERPTD